uniref:Uncharacterized protein n=1 Tax=Brugia malayi TaxID=6279 RepID=A8Q5D7_BRUMA
MNGCYEIILLFQIITEQIVELSAKNIRIGTVNGIEVIKDDTELEHPAENENIGLVSLAKSSRKHERPEEWTWRCGDDQSYYFEPLNECYLISLPQFLNIDPDRKIAYGGTRNEYMFNCWQQYQGKLLDIGSLCPINLETLKEKVIIYFLFGNNLIGPFLSYLCISC